MRKYKIMAGIAAFYVALGAIVLALNPDPFAEPGENLAGQIAIWAAGFFIAAGIIAFIVYKIYRVVNYKIKRKHGDDDINGYVLQDRIERHRFEDRSKGL